MTTEKDHQPIQKVKLRARTIDEVHCPDCSSLVHPSSININKSLGKCDSCGNVFAFEQDHFFVDDRPGRPEMIMPEGTDVLTLSDSLDIRLDWLKSYPKSGLGFLTFFTLVWNLIVGTFVLSAVAGGAASILAGTSLHLVVGLVLIYWLASIYFNKTDIIVKEDEIRIVHGPLKNPFKRDVVIESSDFRQFYVNKYVASTTNGQPNYAYALWAVRANGLKEQIIKGMNKETQLYLEQEIERFLRISDTRVSGATE